MLKCYDLPRKYCSCLNCIHLDQPEGNISGKIIGGCRERLKRFGLPEERLKETYCGQWFLRPLDESDY